MSRRKLGLTPEPVSTQIIPRDRHAYYFATLAVIASSLERLALEIRHLQRTEVGEAEEYFAPGQKGSSAMPHKRNPVLAENLTGLARIVRAAVVPALEDVALWHERDISHSSVERIIAPDTTIALDFALARLSRAHRPAHRPSRGDARQPGAARRPAQFAARAAGADPGGRQPRGGLSHRAAQRDAGVGERHAVRRCAVKPIRK